MTLPENLDLTKKSVDPGEKNVDLTVAFRRKRTSASGETDIHSGGNGYAFRAEHHGEINIFFRKIKIKFRQHAKKTA